jgi:hypothetical protein
MQSLVSVSRAFGFGLVLLGLVACAGSTSGDGLIADEKHPLDIICRNQPNTGSRLPKKVCRTRAEWDALAEASAELHRSLQRDTVEGSITDDSRR